MRNHHPDCALTRENHGDYCVNKGGRTLPTDWPGKGSMDLTEPLELPRVSTGMISVDDLDEMPSLLEKIDYRPDSPRFEMNYIDPDGLQINMSIEIPEDVAEYFNVQNGIDSLAVKMSDVLNDIEYAKGVYIEEMYAMKEREAEVEPEVENLDEAVNLNE